MARVTIDLNVRVGGDQTVVGTDDVVGAIYPGAEVDVIEPESQVVGTGWVAKIDTDKDLVYLTVDWAGLRRQEEIDLSEASLDDEFFAVIQGGGLIDAGTRPDTLIRNATVSMLRSTACAIYSINLDGSGDTRPPFGTSCTFGIEPTRQIEVQ